MHHKRNSWRLYESILREHFFSEALKSNKSFFLFTAPHHKMSVTLYLQWARRSLINSSGSKFSAFQSHFPLYLLPVQLNIWRHSSVEVTVDKSLSWSYIYLTVIVKSCIKSVYSWKSTTFIFLHISHRGDLHWDSFWVFVAVRFLSERALSNTADANTGHTAIVCGFLWNNVALHSF